MELYEIEEKINHYQKMGILSALTLGELWNQIESSKCLNGTEYKDVYDYAKQVHSKRKSTIYNYRKVSELFGIEVQTGISAGRISSQLRHSRLISLIPHTTKDNVKDLLSAANERNTKDWKIRMQELCILQRGAMQRSRRRSRC